jgi:hypothetical protein
MMAIVVLLAVVLLIFQPGVSHAGHCAGRCCAQQNWSQKQC